MTESASPAPRRIPARPRIGVAHLRGLDGLRGIAVASVLAYHADASWMIGGFLGVEMFFTLSGYLITSLLLAEVAHRGRVDLPRFCRARCRRLLPALVVCVLGTLVAYHVLLPHAAAQLRDSALSSLGYVQNWHLVLEHVPYAESFERPDPMLHLWSLAVEGQLYLLWPVLLLAGLALFGRHGVAGLTALLAALSATAMAVLYDPDDVERVFFGTDTRAAGFLVGATLALCYVPWLRRRTRPEVARLLDGGGGLALAALVVALATTSEYSDALYREGGFAAVGLLTAVVVAAAAYPGNRISRLLGRAPLVWLGNRSYGIYLYHWPIFVLTQPGIDVPGPPLLVDAARIGATLLVAELSYRLVELPIRRGALGRLRSAIRLRLPGTRAPVVALSGSGVLVAVLTLSCGPFSGPAAGLGTTGLLAAGLPAAGLPVPGIAAATPTPPAEPTRAVTSPPTAASATAPLVVGDSVVLGSADALLAALGPGTTIDGQVGRQFDRGAAIIAGWAASHSGPVVVHLGSNGIVRPADVDAVVAAAGGRRVVLVDVAVPRRWQQPDNAVLREAADRYPGQVVLVDWASLVAADPSLLGPDRVHPTEAGRSTLAAAVHAALAPR